MPEDTPPPAREVGRKADQKAGIMYLCGAALTLVAGLLFNAAKPVWLAPPLFDYTPLIYVAAMLAWLPLLYVALAKTTSRSRGATLGLVALVIFVQCFCWMSAAPRKDVAELFGSSPVGLLERQCEYTTEQGRTYYACKLRMWSSDSPEEWFLDQKFRVWEGFPVMWRVESSFRIASG